MNSLHATADQDIGKILKILKPLIILYAEEFSKIDPNTNKPILSEQAIDQIKKICLEKGINENDWDRGVELFGPTRISMKSRSLLKEVRSSPDTSGNIYHDKGAILQKILIILDLKQ